MSKIECAQWVDCGMTKAGACKLGYYGGRPSNGTCNLICKLGTNPILLKPTDKDKPLPDELPKLWNELHMRPWGDWSVGNDIVWFNLWLSRVPCGDCKLDAMKYVSDYPFDFSSPDKYFASGIGLHDYVNIKLGKQPWGVDRAKLYYLKT